MTDTTTTYTDEAIAQFNSDFLNHKYDVENNEYFFIYGQFAKPELVGTRKVVTKEEISKEMDLFFNGIRIYGCD